jgi:hypothetical protein
VPISLEVGVDVVQRLPNLAARRCRDRRPLTKPIAFAANALAVVALASGGAARAQDIEPRAYSNAPIGVNFLVAGVAHSSGGLSLDPSIPVTDAKLDTNIAVLAYARVLDLWGVSGKFDVIVPYASLSGTADYAGTPVQRSIHGFANSAFRVSANLYGAPALALSDFAAYRQDLIVGASLQVVAPTSQYDPSRLVNIGTNRWSFKPEVGISKAIDRWTVEGQAAVTLYTDNTNFYGGSTRTQDPLYAFQGHLIYSFRSGAWTSFDATYFAGGRSSIDGMAKNDLQQNWRLGATLALPIDRRHSVKFYASSGVSARTGNNFDLLGVAWQVRWGGGL